MKKLFLLIMPLMALSFNSCSKEDGGDDNGNGSGKLVKMIRYDDNDDDHTVCEFFYDSKGRISKIVSNDHNESQQIDYEYTIDYTYTTNSITKKGYTSDGDMFIETYTLDNNGYVIKGYLDRVDGEYENQSESYKYSDGYISETIWESYGDSTKYIWENGNLTRRVGRETYTYTDKENKFNLNIFEVLYWDYPFLEEFYKFKGASPKNLPASLTYPDPDDGQYIVSYEFDSDDYPIEIICTNNDGRRSKIAVYYY